MTARQDGFTLIELLVVTAIIGVLIALTFVNLGHPQVAANIDDVRNKLLADIKSQQVLAMSGDMGSTATAQAHGLYVESHQFTLFTGSSYSAGDPDNYTEGASSVQLSTTLPSSSLIFSKGSGEVSGFVAGSDTITLASGTESSTITINRFGAITVQ